jgi:hypothetical protein
MKRPFFVVTLVITLVGLFLLGIRDTAISVSDANIPGNEISTSQTQASNSSASATITITMYAVADG